MSTLDQDSGAVSFSADFSLAPHNYNTKAMPHTFVEESKRQTPKHNLTFEPKLVERSNVIKMTHLSKEEILQRLEQERFHRLHSASSNLKADMMASARCPLCTLTLPCKHFESQEQLYTQRGRLFKKQEWSLLSQDNRNAIIKLKLELQRKVRQEQMREQATGGKRCESATASVEQSHLGGVAAETNGLQAPVFGTTTIGTAPQQQPISPSEKNRDLHARRHSALTGSRNNNQSFLHKSGSMAHHGQQSSSNRQTSTTTSNATENFLLKVRINALKNKIGFRGLNMEQRRELEEMIQQEYFNYHFDMGVASGKRAAAESQIEILQAQEEEKQLLRDKMHPWHGKTKQQRKEYIEKLLINFKTGQMEQERLQNAEAKNDFQMSRDPTTAYQRDVLQQQQSKMAKGNSQTQRVSRSANHQKKRSLRKGGRSATKGGVPEAAAVSINSTGMGLQRWDVEEILAAQQSPETQ